MQRIRLLVADADTAHTDNVKRAVARCGGIEFVASAPDGRFALEQIAAFHPDVLLTDIHLPVMDGLELLKRCKRMREPPVCLVCTRFYSDLSVEYACRSGAAYFLYKPIDYSRLPSVIKECWMALRNSETEAIAPSAALNALRTALLEAGIPSNLRGRVYIEEAVRCLVPERWLLKNMTFGLYARVAERTNASPAQIERAMRNAITAAYNRGVLKRSFAHRPSNRDFLEYLLRRIDEASSDIRRLTDPRGIKK